MSALGAWVNNPATVINRGDALFDEELSVDVMTLDIFVYYITETAGFSTGFFYFSKTLNHFSVS